MDKGHTASSPKHGSGFLLKPFLPAFGAQPRIGLAVWEGIFSSCFKSKESQTVNPRPPFPPAKLKRCRESVQSLGGYVGPLPLLLPLLQWLHCYPCLLLTPNLFLQEGSMMTWPFPLLSAPTVHSWHCQMVPPFCSLVREAVLIHVHLSSAQNTV